MKYIIIVPDGMADFPLKELDNKTPLEYAKTPNMDSLAKTGLCGSVNNTPKGFTPGSDIANMNILGINPKKYHSGRAPLEAISEDIPLTKNNLIYRLNFVTIKKNIMKDFTAHHIPTKEAKKLIKYLDKNFKKKFGDVFNLHSGVSYRNLLIFHNKKDTHFNYTPPHNITDQNISNYLPSPEDTIYHIMEEAHNLLKNKKINTTKATDIWLWGQGKIKKIPNFTHRYKIKGSMITAVDLLKGIGKAYGLEILKVPKITGYYDTSYENKAKYALASLKKNDFVFIHIEAPDEAGHEGNVKQKVKAIENVDKKLLGYILKNISFPDYKILILPDHRTPIKHKTHTSDDVPFLIFSSSKSYKINCVEYNEKIIKKTKIIFKEGYKLINYFFKV